LKAQCLQSADQERNNYRYERHRQIVVQLADANWCTFSDSQAKSAIISGWAQLRFRDNRITCQVRPLIGNACAGRTNGGSLHRL
jgi:hypothetical protein